MSEPAASVAVRASRVVRARQKDLREKIASGDTRLGILLLDPPAYVERMTVMQPLRPVRGMGRVRMNQICIKASVLPTHQLRELSRAERRRLVMALPVGALGIACGEGAWGGPIGKKKRSKNPALWVNWRSENVHFRGES